MVLLSMVLSMIMLRREDSHCHCRLRRTGLIETSGYLVNQRQKRSGGGASSPEALLGVREGEMRTNKAGNEAF